MTILIEEIIHAGERTHIHASAGKVSAYVGFHPRGVDVCCLNASNRAWRGSGRCFPSLEAALAAYKSAEMKAIIRGAKDAAEENLLKEGMGAAAFAPPPPVG